MRTDKGYSRLYTIQAIRLDSVQFVVEKSVSYLWNNMGHPFRMEMSGICNALGQRLAKL